MLLLHVNRKKTDRKKVGIYYYSNTEAPDLISIDRKIEYLSSVSSFTDTIRLSPKPILSFYFLGLFFSLCSFSQGEAQ